MLLWTFGSSLASMPSWALRHLGPSGLLGLPCHLGPLCHLVHSCHLRPSYHLRPPYHLRPSYHLRASLPPCALRHHVGLLCHLPSWTLVSSWASKPSCALCHLIPSDLLQPDALSRRWDVYPKGGISESFGTADGLILSSRAPD